ncbi:V-type ATP synthase subunit D [Bacterioplanes sanyensis]|uniref:V-type ATP synthase subunit D n=1 Tax=Bacterioplanes sanyensis TaxID=1249553 RepID=A0A222FEX3_9GAMM|nr:V-type ATP synthase subunit D [Bacterioplanes sanyensis]ASP37299.1 V-type ATP synthase subunit D [Bacterioplanes sanyensis]
MAQLLLSKATLLKERRQLAAYQRFLPSLEMKRQQLMLAVKASEQRLMDIRQQLDELHQIIASDVPMLANNDIRLQPLVTVVAVEYQKENIAGVAIERVEQVQFEPSPVSVLSRPHWVDVVQQRLQQAIEWQLHADAEETVLQLLHAALIKVTQRMNLFDKVLIPQSQKNIRRIQIYLDDKAREAVVTSKIAKNKRKEAML